MVSLTVGKLNKIKVQPLSTHTCKVQILTEQIAICGRLVQAITEPRLRRYTKLMECEKSYSFAIRFVLNMRRGTHYGNVCNVLKKVSLAEESWAGCASKTKVEMPLLLGLTFFCFFKVTVFQKIKVFKYKNGNINS